MIHVEYKGKVYQAVEVNLGYGLLDDDLVVCKQIPKSEGRVLSDEEYHARSLRNVLASNYSKKGAHIDMLDEIIAECKPRPKATLTIPDDAWIENTQGRPNIVDSIAVKWADGETAIGRVENFKWTGTLLSDSNNDVVTHYCEIQIEEE